jgi:septum formation protein
MIQGSPRTIVLASRSPRRLDLALREGWNVEVVVPPEEAESQAPPRSADESLADYVRRLATSKARSVIARSTTGIILACDTLSEVDGVMLGKPTDREDARRMLLHLSGRMHRVVSGVCLWPLPTSHLPLLGDAESTLVMDPLSHDDLEWYLESGLWQGKAGACGFQDERLPLRLVSGSPSNVVGLPLELIREMLSNIDERNRKRP